MRSHVRVGTSLGAILTVVSAVGRYFLVGARRYRGKPADNATFLHAATTDLSGRPVERLSGPLWRRLALRWALLGVPLSLVTWVPLIAGVVGLVWGVGPGLVAPWLNLALWWFALAVAVCAWIAGRRYAVVWRDRRELAEFVRPTWQAACSAMGIPYHERDAPRMVQLPPGFLPPPDAPADEPPPRGRFTAWALSRLDARRLVRVAEAVAAQAAAETALVPAGGPPEPGSMEARRPAPAAPVARWRGRLLRREPLVPDDGPDPADMPPVRVYLTPGKASTAAAKRAFLAAVSEPLGMPDVKAEWQLRGSRPYVDLRPTLLPPERVGLAEVRPAFEAADLAQPVMGLGAGGRAVAIDLDNNSPHTLVSGGSGTGKSVLLRALLAQRMHGGAGVLMIDYKRVSHRWLHGLPGCVYAWRLADIHDALIAAGEELERRLEEVLPDDNDPEAPMTEFATIDVVIEEINSTTALLQSYWVNELGGTKVSPAVQAIQRIVNMGREYRMHVWIAAQRASASVFGANGGDVRESFQTRLMAKWTVATWKMLAGGAPYQRFVGGRGVWARVQDEEVEIVRAPFLTVAEARDWATSGVPCPPTPEVLPGRADGRPVSRSSRDAPVQDIGPELVALSQALSRLPGRPLTVEGIRTASRRPGFPVPVVAGAPGRAGLYDLAALVEWKRSREAAEPAGELPSAGPAGDAGTVVDFGDMPTGDGWQDAFRPPARGGTGRREGKVYALDTLDPETGAVVVGYVGQTVRTLTEREAEHRGDKPWADLIVGSIRLLWSTGPGPVDAEELDAAERAHIARLRPRYNVEHQLGAPWAVPKWAQVEARHARDDAAGRPRWYPVDVYGGERRPEER